MVKNTVEVKVTIYGKETQAGFTAYCPAFRRSVIGHRPEDAERILAEAIKRVITQEEKLYEAKHNDRNSKDL